MTPKSILAAVFVTLLPVAGFAACSGHEETAASCKDGFKWDTATAACVEVVTG